MHAVPFALNTGCFGSVDLSRLELFLVNTFFSSRCFPRCCISSCQPFAGGQILLARTSSWFPYTSDWPTHFEPPPSPPSTARGDVLMWNAQPSPELTPFFLFCFFGVPFVFHYPGKRVFFLLGSQFQPSNIAENHQDDQLDPTLQRLESMRYPGTAPACLP